jgi:hypothetical protein
VLHRVAQTISQSAENLANVVDEKVSEISKLAPRPGFERTFGGRRENDALVIQVGQVYVDARVVTENARKAQTDLGHIQEGLTHSPCCTGVAQKTVHNRDVLSELVLKWSNLPRSTQDAILRLAQIE